MCHVPTGLKCVYAGLLSVRLWMLLVTSDLKMALVVGLTGNEVVLGSLTLQERLGLRGAKTLELVG